LLQEAWTTVEALKRKIRDEGRVLPGNILLVDQFLNQQVDTALLRKMADHWYLHFLEKDVTKVLTIEASGIAVGVMVASRFGVPLLFAKKYASMNVTPDAHEVDVFSYTKQTTYRVSVSKRLLGPEDKVLIIDDFLARGNALKGLLELCGQAGAKVVGVGIAIEKAFQGGRRVVEDYGVEIVSLASIAELDGDRGIVRFVGD
jgi:xanthine phosphoribosyltransferase